MKKNILIFILFLFFLSCKTSSKIISNNINGIWELQGQKYKNDYPGIEFNSPDVCALYVIGDTIFRGHYKVFKKIIVMEIKGNRYENPVVYMDSKKMVFSSFMEIQDTLTYLKIKR